MISENTDINILKSTIDNLIQENKQLLESNKQLKTENRKLRDSIYVYACSYESHIKNILGWSTLLSEHYESSQQLTREQIKGMITAIYRTAKKLKVTHRAHET